MSVQHNDNTTAAVAQLYNTRRLSTDCHHGSVQGMKRQLLTIKLNHIRYFHHTHVLQECQ